MNEQRVTDEAVGDGLTESELATVVGGNTDPDDPTSDSPASR